ncbi:MAG: hypothetical protein QXP77_00085 [Candidatus Aenigmatarchaeota archaeon]
MPSKTMLFIIIFAIVLVVLTIFFLMKWLGWENASACIRGQYSEIDNIEEKLRNARETGNEYIEPFEMKWCANCIWYDPANSSLSIIFYEEKTPVQIPVEGVWNVINGKSKSLISPGFTYRFYITKFGIVDCFNCDNTNQGNCEVS